MTDTNDFAHIEVYSDTAGEWRWRMIAANGRIIAASAEAFANKSNARRAARHLADQLVETAAVLVKSAQVSE